MKKALILLGFLVLHRCALGQDMSWLLDEAPTVSMVLVKALENAPSFSAKADIQVTGAADPTPSTATGTVEFEKGNLRWVVRLGEIRSTQLSSNARAAIQQINGERFVLLTRPDRKTNYLVLPGAHACLEQPLPALRLVTSKTERGIEPLDGRSCSKERLTAIQGGGKTNPVVLWRAKSLKNLPLQLQFSESGETIQVRFREVTLRTIGAQQFNVPNGLAKYSSLEDLVQSVVLEKVKKRIGL